MIPFKTFHRVESQGYILYRKTKKLKAEYRELPGQEIGELVKSGVDVHDIETTPEVAYTGREVEITTVLQIRRGNRDNLGIVCIILP